ncbi:MAG: hypothetical protein IPK82_28770 [Polyangiaceae bacterium]|nr:hypothetical protein [Polyangiaceae bacterium]
MDRTQVYFTPEEREALDRRAEELGQTPSHLIRELVTAYLQTPSADEVEKAILASQGAWKRRTGDIDIDGATYVERIRTGRRLQTLLQPSKPAVTRAAKMGRKRAV